MIYQKPNNHDKILLFINYLGELIFGNSYNYRVYHNSHHNVYRSVYYNIYIIVYIIIHIYILLYIS